MVAKGMTRKDSKMKYFNMVMIFVGYTLVLLFALAVFQYDTNSIFFVVVLVSGAMGATYLMAVEIVQDWKKIKDISSM